MWTLLSCSRHYPLVHRWRGYGRSWKPTNELVSLDGVHPLLLPYSAFSAFHANPHHTSAARTPVPPLSWSVAAAAVLHKDTGSDDAASFTEVIDEILKAPPLPEVEVPADNICPLSMQHPCIYLCIT